MDSRQQLFIANMQDILADKHIDDRKKIQDGIQIMCEELADLGYSGGIRIFKKLYDYTKKADES